MLLPSSTAFCRKVATAAIAQSPSSCRPVGLCHAELRHLTLPALPYLVSQILLRYLLPYQLAEQGYKETAAPPTLEIRVMLTVPLKNAADVLICNASQLTYHLF